MILSGKNPTTKSNNKYTSKGEIFLITSVLQNIFDNFSFTVFGIFKQNHRAYWLM